MAVIWQMNSGISILSQSLWRDAAAKFPLEMVYQDRGVENPSFSQFS